MVMGIEEVTLEISFDLRRLLASSSVSLSLPPHAPLQSRRTVAGRQDGVRSTPPPGSSYPAAGVPLLRPEGPTP